MLRVPLPTSLIWEAMKMDMMNFLAEAKTDVLLVSTSKVVGRDSEEAEHSGRGTKKISLGDQIQSDVINKGAFHTSSPRELLLGSEQSKYLKEAVAALPKKQRSLIEMRHLSKEPLGIREAADRLHVSRSYAHELEQKALVKLSQTLTKITGQIEILPAYETEGNNG